MEINKPWLSEPNALDFVDTQSGYHIALRRHPELLHWCGYVGIPREHPWYGKTYQSVEEDVRVHGGLTYSDNAVHRSQEGLWWYGFDCAHAGDFVPKLAEYGAGFKFALPTIREDIYRDIEYVKKEAIELARQLGAVGPKRQSILDINRMFG